MRKTILTTAPLAALLLLSCAQKPSTQKPDITYMPQPPFNPHNGQAPDTRIQKTNWSIIHTVFFLVFFLIDSSL